MAGGAVDCGALLIAKGPHRWGQSVLGGMVIGLLVPSVPMAPLGLALQVRCGTVGLPVEGALGPGRAR